LGLQGLYHCCTRIRCGETLIALECGRCSRLSDYWSPEGFDYLCLVGSEAVVSFHATVLLLDDGQGKIHTVDFPRVCCPFGCCLGVNTTSYQSVSQQANSNFDFQ
jgi:hypothetical protein